MKRFRWLSLSGFVLTSLLGIVGAILLVIIGVHGVLAISRIGPDSTEYGGEAMWYELSNTQYVDSTVMAVPLYMLTKPAANVPVTVTTSPDGGANGVITVEGVVISALPSTTTVISEPAGSFILDPNTGYYKAILNATISGAQADDNYKLFRMSVSAASGGIIGYSSLLPNTNHFAVGGQNRCDGGGDVSGCGRYFSWRLPFAPACNQASGNATVSIFDVDDTDPGAGTIFGNFGVQPTPLSVQIWDTTTNTAASPVYDPATSPGGWGQGETKNITFAFTQFHKYQARLSNVYANNVIQFKLPFDSVNTLVSCPTGGISSSVTASCSQINGYMYDRDNPALAMQYYIYVNPKAGTPTVFPNYAAVQQFLPAPAPAPIGSGFRGPGPANTTYPGYPGAPVPANHGFSILIPAAVSAFNYNGDWADNTYWIYAKSAGAANLNRIGVVTPRAVAGTPGCGQVTCNAAMTTFSGNVGVGTPINFIVWASITGATTLPPGASFAVAIKNSGGVTVQSYSPAVASPPPGVLPGNVTSASMSFTPLVGGTYTANWSYHGANCTGPSVTANYQPYFSVLGGDVAAGVTNNVGVTACAQLASGTAAGDAAIVRSWNYDNNPVGAYNGAGGQTGVFALGQISSFISGMNPLAVPSAVQSTFANPYDASFSNTVATNIAQAKYGGSFGSYGYCAADYTYLANQRTTINNGGGGSFDITGKNGTYHFPGLVRLTGTLSPDQHLTIIGQNDIIIDNDLSYPGGVASTADVPYLEVLADNGSIYVQPNVHSMYGFYDAQGGAFVTCANNQNETTDYDTCNSQLVIDGAVSADSVHFDRTFGNLTAVAGLPGGGTPSEIIRFSPALWIGAIGFCKADPTVCPSGGYPYDAVTALPPTL